MHYLRASWPPGGSARIHSSCITALASVVMILLGTGRPSASERIDVAERFLQNNQPRVVAVEGWQLRPVAELRVGYTDNVEWRSDLKTGSPEATLRGSIDAIRQTGPHSVQIRGSHATTFYAEGSARTASNTSIEAAITMRPSIHTQLRASIGYDAVREPGPSNGIEDETGFANYADFSAYQRLPLGLGLVYDLGRYRLEIDASSGSVHFDDQVTVTGDEIPQDFRSGWEHDVRARATWSIHPSLEAFVESAIGFDRYLNDTADTDRFSIAAGGRFDPHPLLRASVLAGFAQQEFRIADGASGIVFAGEMTWFMSPLVTVSLDARRDFRGNVTSSGSSAFFTEPATSDSVGLAVDWEPLRQMLVSARSSWVRDTTRSGNRRDTAYRLELQTRYVLTDRLEALLELEHETGQSNVIGDVSRNRISIGVASSY